MQMYLWQIILGVLTAAFLIFLKNAHSKAHKQKMVVTRLRSYLLYWQGFILDNNLFDIFHMGIEWNEKIDQIIKDGGGGKDIVALKNEKQKELDDLKKQIVAESDKAKIDKEAIQKILKKIPKNTTKHILEYARMNEQNLVDGKTFISDEEACYLGNYVAQISIELKMNLKSLINSGLGLVIVILSNPEEFSLKEHADDIVELVWKGIVVSKHIDSLTKKVELFTKLSVFDLTMKNLRGEL
ncbi:hypothetical protein KAU51_04470 [Candidatus Parcubacteria bacterium]|nr:hypothetical protein [Candidatus Parcubacteria bacterium]